MDTSTLFQTATNDWALVALNTLFAGGSTLSQTLALYNTIIMIAAVATMFYLATHAIVETAHTGKVLGNWSEIWWPARMVIAIGLAAPLPPDGLNAAQQAIYLAAQVGSYGANSEWNFIIDDLAGNLNPVIMPPSPSVEDLARGLFMSAACESAANTLAANGGNQAWITEQQLTPLPVNQTVANEKILAFTGDRSQGFTEKTCGALVFAATTAASQSTVLTYPTSSSVPTLYSPNYPNNATVQNTDPTVAALLNANMTAALALLTAIKPVAASVVAQAADAASPAAMPSFGGIPNAITQYGTSMAATTSTQFSSNQTSRLQAFSDAAKASGWSGAGSYMMRISDINGMILRAANAVPRAVPPDLSSGFSKTSLAEMQRILAVASQWWTANMAQSGIGNSMDQAYLAGNDSANFLGQFGLRSGLFNALFFNAGDLNNPLAAMTAFGHKLIFAFWSAVTASAAVVFAASAADTVGNNPIVTAASFGTSLLAGTTGKGLLAVLTQFGWLPMILLLSMLGAGVTFAYVLPYMFFAYWLFAVQQWLQRVGLGMLAGPVWALAHMNPEGPGVMGKNAESGYALLAETILRPMIMVIGLVFALAVVLLMSGYFLPNFQITVANSLAGHTDLFTGAVAYLVLGTGTMFAIVSGAFWMVTRAPDMVLGMAGIRGSGDGGEIEGRHREVVAGGAAVTRSVESATQTTVTRPQIGPRQPTSRPPGGGGSEK